jgi:pimeloyl-ACP methyl ester carboxylesterase
MSGLPAEKIRATNVTIWEGCTIRTVEVGFDEPDELPKLVFIHGYGGSGALFFNIMEPLSHHFHCYFIDIIGMGGSSRWPYNADTPEDSEQYFLRFLEAWRVAAGNLTNFNLSGHSFGGYLAGLYAANFPLHIKKLLLVSPIGFTDEPPAFQYSGMRFRGGNDEKGNPIQRVGPPSIVLPFTNWVWEKRVSPFWVQRKLGQGLTKRFIASYVDKRMNTNGNVD